MRALTLRTDAPGTLRKCKGADTAPPRMAHMVEPFRASIGCPEVQGEETMSAKILSTAIIAGLLFAVSAPAFAADAPKTKADCEKMTNMKWDDAKKVCVKK